MPEPTSGAEAAAEIVRLAREIERIVNKFTPGRNFPSKLDRDVRVLDIQTRTMYALLNCGFYTLYDVVTASEDLLRKKNVGEKAIGDLKQFLEKEKLRLGMTDTEIAAMTSPPKPPKPGEVGSLNDPVERLDLPKRVLTQLHHGGVKNVRDLVSKRPGLEKVRRMGPTSLYELGQALSANQLWFNMTKAEMSAWSRRSTPTH